MTSPLAADRVQSETLALTRQLLARPSLTPDDAGCLDLIADRLAACGFQIEFIDRGGVRNLWARRGDAAPLVCFAGHVDVVPTGPEGQWSAPPFGGVERDGLLIGRGASDMKASVAAIVTACERLACGVQPLTGSLAVLLTSDEEGDALHGTLAVVEALRARSIVIDHSIIGEPTSVAVLGDTIKNGRRGSLTGMLRVIGVQGHVAYPERANNPVHLAAPALTELCAIEWDQGDADFGPTTFQISNIHAGTGAPNVVPGDLTAQFNLRFSPVWSVEALQTRVRDVLARHNLEFELEWTVSAMPFVTAGDRLTAALRQAIASTTGVEASVSTTGGTSDGRFLKAVAREIAEFGPLNDTIHKVDERVRVADLGPLSTIYEQTARTLLNG